MHPISEILQKHYSAAFKKHGATSKGVDWGDEKDVLLRYDKMMAVANYTNIKINGASILDVGCGYGGLYIYATDKNIKLDYTGIDIAQNIIEYAKANVLGANFIYDDILDGSFNDQYDFVVCNGILTQNLTASKKETDKYANALIKKMFQLCNYGIAFNVMTTNVNFMVDNLYYRSPVEMLGYCFTEVSSKFAIDHSYPLYEYTVYLLKE